MSATDIAAIPHDRLVKAQAVSAFMLGEGRQIPDPNVTLGRMAELLQAAGVPLDRTQTIVPLLHAEHVASSRIWDSQSGIRSFTFPFTEDTGEGYQKSPAAVVHETGEWLELWLPSTSDDTFGIVPDLKEVGFVHYLCAPVFMANGMKSTFSFATRHQAGFSPDDIAVLRTSFPAIAACQEILATHRMMGEVMRMYVGNEPYQRIAAGDVHRGEVMKIRSAILFADMRRFTELTSKMSAEEATGLLNVYYDCIVPPIEASGGEVLKFIGDGILAIFRAEETGRSAVRNAAAAARQGLAAVRDCKSEPRFDVGIALHFGEAAFGNVGSGARLDYTVIGRDVNFAARIAGLCGTLDRSLLVSTVFRELLDDPNAENLGARVLKGLDRPEEIFALHGPLRD